MKIIQKHSLTIDEVKQKLENNFLPGLQKKFSGVISNLSYAWTDNVADFSFHLLGSEIKGKITIAETELIFEADLPLMAKMFEGQMKQIIAKGLQKFFG